MIRCEVDIAMTAGIQLNREILILLIEIMHQTGTMVS